MPILRQGSWLCSDRLDSEFAGRVAAVDTGAQPAGTAAGWVRSYRFSYGYPALGQPPGAVVGQHTKQGQMQLATVRIRIRTTTEPANPRDPLRDK